MFLEIVPGKLAQVPTAAEVCTSVPSHRLRVTDRSSGLCFLVDTGADISVLPSKLVLKNNKNSECQDYYLFAANGTKIKTYGVKILVLDLGLRRALRWTFVIADVNAPILGADFLANFKLLVDISARRLIDEVTNLKVLASIVSSNESSIKTVDVSHPYYDLLAEFPDITKPVSFKEPPKHSVLHYIETSGPPVYARCRPLPPHRYAKVREEFRLMQELGICRPSKSAWASPLHIVSKKNGQLRPCGDYRALNAITKADRYPIPRIHDFTYSLANAKIFSRVDICRAYHFISVNSADVEKTAIITPFGLFEFPRMTFGLKNAAQTFQRFMNHTVLSGLDYVYCYIDDVAIFSKNKIEHEQHLREVFSRLSKFGLTINLEKCEFGKSKIEFLGYEVSTEGIRPLQEKMDAINNFPKPATVEQLRRFLGMVNFYRLHLPHAVEYQSHLNQYLVKSKKKDKTKIEWTESANEAFLRCKAALQSAVTLSYPQPDTPLALMTDASNTYVGAVLQQFINDKWIPLGYFSKKMSTPQTKYSTFDRELLAIYLAIKYFQNMVEGRHLIIYTDHKPLTFMFKKSNSDNELPRRVRQILYISEFSTDIRHIDGDKNVVADTLSRVETITCATVLDYAAIAQAQVDDTNLKLLRNQRNDNKYNLIFKDIAIPGSHLPVTCETSTNKIRPYIPLNFRKQAFESVHNLSHPGIRTSRKLVKERFFWEGMNSDIGKWTKSCIKCQRAKVSRHVKTELGHFSLAERFSHIHVDIVGPLPTSIQDYRYLVTIIDRQTGWPEAYPTKDITAETVAKVIFEGWIARFGCPVKLTSDQGRQFESSVFKELMRYLGIDKKRTTPYHPQSNGMIERWHRSLKAALMARLNSTTWVDELPIVLLGLRAANRDDTGVSAAELTYATPLRLPGDFYNDTDTKILDNCQYVQKLQDIIKNLKPKPMRHKDARTLFVYPDLDKCTHVFVRSDRVRRPLEPPYDGPFRVIGRKDKTYLIDFSGRTAYISIDRLKPAYMCKESTNNIVSNKNKLDNKNIDISTGPATAISDNRSALANESAPLLTTRSGRVSKKPVRFNF